MKDRDFLIWMHERLVKVYKESPITDYMHKLRAIIAATPKSQETPNVLVYNNITELIEPKGESDKNIKEDKLC